MGGKENKTKTKNQNPQKQMSSCYILLFQRHLIEFFFKIGFRKQNSQESWGAQGPLVQSTPPAQAGSPKQVAQDRVQLFLNISKDGDCNMPGR